MLQLSHVHNNSFYFQFLLFFLQIHANCRIRRVYFSDRLYSNKELPEDFKVNISGENQPALSTNTVETAAETAVETTGETAEMSLRSTLRSPVPAGSEHQGQREGLSKPRTETGSPTPARSPGPEHRREFHTILDSVEKEPLKLWQKEVSIYKTLNLLQPASFVVVHEHLEPLTILYCRLYFEDNQMVSQFSQDTNFIN